MQIEERRINASDYATLYILYTKTMCLSYISSILVANLVHILYTLSNLPELPEYMSCYLPKQLHFILSCFFRFCKSKHLHTFAIYFHLHSYFVNMAIYAFSISACLHCQHASIYGGMRKLSPNNKNNNNHLCLYTCDYCCYYY